MRFRGRGCASRTSGASGDPGGASRGIEDSATRTTVPADPGQVQQVVSEGALGRVVLFESHFDRFRPERKPNAWREEALPGSGVWFDIGPHLFDQALLLFGVPDAIGADIRIEREGTVVDDAFDVTLYYPHMRVLLRASMLAPPVGPSWIVHGMKGSFIKYGMDPQEAALKEGHQQQRRPR